jgi:hypothetical protein
MTEYGEPELGPRTCASCGAQIPSGIPSCELCGDAWASLEALSTISATADGASGQSVGVPGIDLLRAGDTYADRFTVSKILGRGGMGWVYLVDDSTSGQRMALKILRSNLTGNRHAVSRFEREIRLLSKIEHPSIPKLFEWGRHGETFFFLTQFVAGDTLEALIQERGALPAAEAAALVAGIADALASAHAAGVIHRDIKPSNVIVSGDGSVHLIDFGIARATGPDMTTLTETGVLVGTPHYMSPEQLRSHRVDERSDIYSLGVVLFELLSGQRPFEGETPMAIALAHLNDEAPALRRLNPKVPGWAVDVVERCMAKDPGRRFWTANEVARELRRPHGAKGRRKRLMRNGDEVLEDLSGSGRYSLVIGAQGEVAGWDENTALFYHDRYHRLVESVPRVKKTDRWIYRFEPWPEGEILRRVVDYEAVASIEPSQPTLGDSVRSFFRKLGGS